MYCPYLYILIFGSCAHASVVDMMEPTELSTYTTLVRKGERAKRDTKVGEGVKI